MTTEKIDHHHVYLRFGWFTGFDWEELREGEMQAPPIPQGNIHHAHDHGHADDHDYIGSDHGHDDQDGDCVRNDDMFLQDWMILTTVTPC